MSIAKACFLGFGYIGYLTLAFYLWAASERLIGRFIGATMGLLFAGGLISYMIWLSAQSAWDKLP